MRAQRGISPHHKSPCVADLTLVCIYHSYEYAMINYLILKKSTHTRSHTFIDCHFIAFMTFGSSSCSGNLKGSLITLKVPNSFNKYQMANSNDLYFQEETDRKGKEIINVLNQTNNVWHTFSTKQSVLHKLHSLVSTYFFFEFCQFKCIFFTYGIHIMVAANINFRQVL